MGRFPPVSGPRSPRLPKRELTQIPVHGYNVTFRPPNRPASRSSSLSRVIRPCSSPMAARSLTHGRRIEVAAAGTPKPAATGPTGTGRQECAFPFQGLPAGGLAPKLNSGVATLSDPQGPDWGHFVAKPKRRTPKGTQSNAPSQHDVYGPSGMTRNGVKLTRVRKPIPDPDDLSQPVSGAVALNVADGATEIWRITQSARNPAPLRTTTPEFPAPWSASRLHPFPVPVTPAATANPLRRHGPNRPARPSSQSAG